MAYAQGAAAALPVVAMFLQKVYADASLGYDPEEDFMLPKEISEAWFDAQQEWDSSEPITEENEILNP